jgi:predicted dehydrogenase/nucleoside-diphosphate-sugar epimerase
MNPAVLDRSDLGVSGSTSPTAAGPLRIAIVGAGKMAQHHARAIRRLDTLARVVGVADPATGARQAIRAIWPEADAYPDLESLLAVEAVDVVHICTPPATHEALAAQAVGAGCHVYVEKPFVETASAAERILSLAAESGLKVCAGHQLLFEAPARRALELLPALGTLSHIESYFSFRTVRRAADGRTPLRADLQLLDILPHPVYLLLHFLEQAAPEEQTELTALEVGPAGTVHALVRRGMLTATLIVTLDGRPVESYLRLVGTNGSVHADFVRSTVQRLIGPGTSGIDKLLNPYRHARQLLFGTTQSLGGRFLRRQRSYPGLAEIFDAFYRSVGTDAPSPVSPQNILDTVRIAEQVANALRTARPRPRPAQSVARAAIPLVTVTGGTGFLGKELVEVLAARGAPVRVLARREPPTWEQLPGAEYRAVDLSEPLPADALAGTDVVVHAAAATAGGWDEHQKHSLDATENVLRAAATAGVNRVIHVSSLAVLGSDGARAPLSEESPLETDSRSRGPYVWGKLESERLAVRLGEELGIDVKVVRPGAIIDYRNFEPPGRLGKRLGNVFVAVGSPRETLGVVDVHRAASMLAWMAEHFDQMPPVLHLIEPEPPTRLDLTRRLRATNPGLSVVWLPWLALRPLSGAVVGLQRLLRPGRPAVSVARVFASQTYDTERIVRLSRRLNARAPGRAEMRADAPSAAPTAF